MNISLLRIKNKRLLKNCLTRLVIYANISRKPVHENSQDVALPRQYTKLEIVSYEKNKTHLLWSQESFRYAPDTVRVVQYSVSIVFCVF